MKTTNDYIAAIKASEHQIRNEFGVRSLTLFGSVARGEQKEDSDLDVFVEMEPNIYALVRLKDFLEKNLGIRVDLVRNHAHINPFLLEQINNDRINVLQ